MASVLVRIAAACAVAQLAFGAPLGAGAQTRVPESSVEVSLSYAPVVKTAAPAVVNIYVRQVVQARQSPFAQDPFFGQFFHDFAPSRPQVANSLGSGVLVSADGIVVSNHHVTQDAADIRVILADRREYDAKVLLSDPISDLAILKIDTDDALPALPLGDSEALDVGDLVLAIGNPFGVGQTVSSGIVSGLARSALQVGDGSGYFIQTDAPINPGNSGGALVDMAGRLVGINTAIMTASGGSNGIGFAIPSNLVAQVIRAAQAGDTQFTRPWAGIGAQNVDGHMAEAIGMTVPQGVMLSELHPQSPFAEAGLVEGDIVLSLNGAPVNSPQELLYRMSTLGMGEVDVIWTSMGAEKSGRLPLRPAPDAPTREAQTFGPRDGVAGLSVARINPAVIQEMNLSLRATGVVVTGAEGLAARAGFLPGDVILGVNGERVEHPRDLARLGAEGLRHWQVDLLRRGQALRLRFRL